MISIEEYTKRLTDSLRMVKHSHVFSGKNGAEYFAKEYGAGLAWYPEEQAREYIRKSYSMCVIGYDLKPPINAKDWLRAVNTGYDRAKNRKNMGGIIAHE
jgi:hypothetical protein